MKSPCDSCEFELCDKNYEPCSACKKPVEYEVTIRDQYVRTCDNFTGVYKEPMCESRHII